MVPPNPCGEVGAVVPAMGYGTIVAAGSQSGKSVGQKAGQVGWRSQAEGKVRAPCAN